MHARPPPQDLRSHQGPHCPPPLPRADSEPGHHCLGSRVSRCCRVPSPHRWIHRGHLPFQVPPGFAGRCCGPGAAPGGGQGVLMPRGRLLLFAHIPWSGTGENAEPCSPRVVPRRAGGSPRSVVPEGPGAKSCTQGSVPGVVGVSGLILPALLGLLLGSTVRAGPWAGTSRGQDNRGASPWQDTLRRHLPGRVPRGGIIPIRVPRGGIIPC